MFDGKKVVVVMPAYNAERTLVRTVGEIDRSIVDEIILVDDCSSDDTVMMARSLGLSTIRHEQNKGYGGNQKTCYREALSRDADIVIMVHPDYQYSPKLIPAMVGLLTSGLYDVVLASRILGGKAIQGGMPLYKYFANRFLTLAENLLTGMKLSEFHTGYRAYTRQALLALPLDQNSDDFIFDNQVLVQFHLSGMRIAEVTCPTKYFAEASSINFVRSSKYGLGCLWTGILYRLAVWRLYNAPIFNLKAKRLVQSLTPLQNPVK